jgi:beta-glucosidase
METAIDGFQGRPGELDEPDRVLATAKHYAGDGDTEYGTGSGDYPIDQGITVTSRRDFARIDLAPYVAAVGRHDVGSVMPSFSSVDWTDDGVGDPLKMHTHRELITGTLKGRLGFDGFVISDWEGIHQIPATTPPRSAPASRPGSTCSWSPSATRASRPPCWPRWPPATCPRPGSTTPCGAS